MESKGAWAGQPEDEDQVNKAEEENFGVKPIGDRTLRYRTFGGLQVLGRSKLL